MPSSKVSSLLCSDSQATPLSAFLPAELWTKIFGFACTDGGAMGRSLSLVSRYINAASRPVKYQSISLVGADKILRFLATLAGVPSKDRRVRHLFIVDHDPLAARLALRSFRAVGRMDDAFRAFLSILELVARHIRTLTILSNSSKMMQTSFPIDLPALEELTLQCTIICYHYTLDKLRVAFPNLRRLYLGGGFCDINHFAAIRSLAPALTHLFLTNQLVTSPSKDFPEVLHQAMADADGDKDRASNTEIHPPPHFYHLEKLPSSLQRVFLQLDKEDTVPSGAFVPETHGESNARLRKMAEMDKRLVLLDAELQEFEALRQGWEERINGGEGWWKEQGQRWLRRTSVDSRMAPQCGKVFINI